MDERITIRMSSNEKEQLQAKRQQYGFQSDADFARFLIEKGMQNLDLSNTDTVLISNSIQGVDLLRTLVRMIAVDKSEAEAHIINGRETAKEWTANFRKKAQGNTV